MLESIQRLDRTLFLAINNGWAGPVNDVLIAGWTFLGETWVLALLLVPVLYLTDRARLRFNLIFLAGALVSSSLISSALKHAIHRPRPLKDMEALIQSGAVQVRVVFEPLRQNAMPSGHTVTAFAAAAALALVYPRFAPVFWVAAVLTGLSRIYVGAHYPTDVLAGALLGAGCAWAVHRLLLRCGSAATQVEAAAAIPPRRG